MDYDVEAFFMDSAALSPFGIPGSGIRRMVAVETLRLDELGLADVVASLAHPRVVVFAMSTDVPRVDLRGSAVVYRGGRRVVGAAATRLLNSHHWYTRPTELFVVVSLKEARTLVDGLNKRRRAMR